MKMIRTNQVEANYFKELILEANCQNTDNKLDELMDYFIENRTDLWIDNFSQQYQTEWDTDFIWDYFSQVNDPQGYRWNQVCNMAQDWILDQVIDFIYDNNSLPIVSTENGTFSGLLASYFDGLTNEVVIELYSEAHPTEVRNQIIESLLD